MQRKQYSGDFKAKVAIEAIKATKTINGLASQYEVHPNQVTRWKKQVLEEVPQIFSTRRAQAQKETEELTASLYQQIGQLQVELDWMKKKSGLSRGR